MKISEKFASNFLKAEDLQGRKHHVIIASVGTEQINNEDHVAVYFRGKQKALICNKTNGSYLANAISDETDDWPGHEVVLYPTKVNFQGKMVDAIRVEMPSPVEPKQPVKPPQTAAVGEFPGDSGRSASAELNDEIPW
jgi:hypothetical protein